jgi:hypothetical protein
MCFLRRTDGVLISQKTAFFIVTAVNPNRHFSPVCLSHCEDSVKLSVFLTTEALRHEGAWGSGCIDPHFLDLGQLHSPVGGH